MGFIKDETYAGSGRKVLSGTTILIVVLSAVSIIGTVLVIAYFGQISAVIAITVANLLSAGIPLFLGIIALFCLAAGFRRRRRCRSRDWY